MILEGNIKRERGKALENNIIRERKEDGGIKEREIEREIGRNSINTSEVNS